MAAPLLRHAPHTNQQLPCPVPDFSPLQRLAGGGEPKRTLSKRGTPPRGRIARLLDWWFAKPAMQVCGLLFLCVFYVAGRCHSGLVACQAAHARGWAAR